MNLLCQLPDAGVSPPSLSKGLDTSSRTRAQHAVLVQATCSSAAPARRTSPRYPSPALPQVTKEAAAIDLE